MDVTTSIDQAGKSFSGRDDIELIKKLVADNFSLEEYRNNNTFYDTGDFPSIEIALERIKDY